MCAVVILSAWALAVVVTAAIATQTKIGPVVVRFTATHGLHAGDVRAILIMAICAAIVTVVMLTWCSLTRGR